MQLSENGKKLIKTFEGLRLNAYKCSAGVWTVGYGHTGKVDGKNVQFGTKITQAKADALFNQDIKAFEDAVNKIKLNLNQNQFDALVSFTFNLGVGCLNTLIKNRNLIQIADAMLLYNKTGGKVVDGLVKRRKAERQLFLTTNKSEEKQSEIKEIKEGKKEIKQEVKEEKILIDISDYSSLALPFKVKAKQDSIIRSAAGTNYPKIGTARKGAILTIWAVCTSGGIQWGKNGNQYYNLKEMEYYV